MRPQIITECGFHIHLELVEWGDWRQDEPGGGNSHLSFEIETVIMKRTRYTFSMCNMYFLPQKMLQIYTYTRRNFPV